MSKRYQYYGEGDFTGYFDYNNHSNCASDYHRTQSHPSKRRRRDSPTYEPYDEADLSAMKPNNPDNSSRPKSPMRIEPQRQRTPSPPPIPAPLQPSRDYLNTSSQQSSVLERPSLSRKLLILDLNGTLLYRSKHQHRARYQPGERVADDPYRDPYAPRGLRPVHPRPYIQTFREYLFHQETRPWLDVMIWSSAQPHSVADMVEKCFSGEKQRLYAVWARDTLGLAHDDYYKKTQTTKDLDKPWSSFSSGQSSSRSTVAHSAYTTLLLDDSPLKARLQPYNHVCIREYVYEMRQHDVTVYRAEHEKKLRALVKASMNNKVNEEEPQLSKKRLKKAKKAAAKLSATESRKEQSLSSMSSVGAGSEDVAPKLSKKEKKKAKEAAAELLATESPGDQSLVSASCAVTGSEDNEVDPIGSGSHLQKIRDRTDEADYDQTLLAVIGILDTVKNQSNVSGWIRAGGLLGQPNADILELSAETDREKTSSPDAEGPPSFSPPLLSENEPPSDTAGNVTGSLQAQKMWFEDKETVRFWATRGQHALEQLGIPLNAGIKEQ